MELQVLAIHRRVDNQLSELDNVATEFDNETQRGLETTMTFLDNKVTDIIGECITLLTVSYKCLQDFKNTLVLTLDSLI